jgi:hypothetical protein
MHRFLWDMHYTPLPGGGGRGGYPMQAIFQDTALSITSIWAAPGRYTAKLTVNGHSYSQPLTLRMDPRVKNTLGVQQQFTMSKQLYDEVLAAQKAHAELRAFRTQVQALEGRAQGPAAEAMAAFDKKAADLEGATGGGRGGRGGGGGGGGRGGISSGPETLSTAGGSLTALIRLLEGADVAPSTQLAAAVTNRRTAVAAVIQKWTALKTTDLAALNVQLKQANLPELKLEPAPRAGL